MRRPDLAERSLNYDSPGATRPAEPEWGEGRARHRSHERSVRIGQGDNHWEVATSALLRWGIKVRSGFVVKPCPTGPVGIDDRYWLVARFGPVSVREPVQVVAVVDEPDRRGFAYGTLDGHPVAGEEAFVLHRTPDGAVWLTLRSLTGAPRGRWRLAFPIVLVAQRWYRRRYLRALLDPAEE